MRKENSFLEKCGIKAVKSSSKVLNSCAEFLNGNFPEDLDAIWSCMMECLSIDEDHFVVVGHELDETSEGPQSHLIWRDYHATQGFQVFWVLEGKGSVSLLPDAISSKLSYTSTSIQKHHDSLFAVTMAHGELVGIIPKHLTYKKIEVLAGSGLVLNRACIYQAQCSGRSLTVRFAPKKNFSADPDSFPGTLRCTIPNKSGTLLPSKLEFEMRNHLAKNEESLANLSCMKVYYSRKENSSSAFSFQELDK